MMTRIKPRPILAVLKIAGLATAGYALMLAAVALLASLRLAEPQTSWVAIGSIGGATAAAVGAWTLIALRRDSLDRTRPVIVAEFQPNVLAEATELLIRNVGQSVAKNVKFTFDPQLPAMNGSHAAATAAYYVQRRYSRIIPTFGPGMMRHDVYRFGRASESDRSPAEFTLTINYEDAHRRHYTDSYDLAVVTERDTAVANPGGDSPEALGKRTIRALEAIARGVGRR